MLMTEFIRFRGNCPTNVSRDAKYSVRYEEGDYVVGVVYRSDEGEIWYPISGEHPDLVEMVNAIKVHYNGQPGGAFYINEYKQVIVPAGGNGEYYLAGEYEQELKFELEGKIFSGSGLTPDGKQMQPGDKWEGIHPGIPYTLAASGKDIYFRYEARPRVEKEERLSRVIGKTKAAAVAKMIADVKGKSGGRFYINEFRQMFTPKDGEYGVEYIYIGKLEDMKNWFPKPHLSETEVAASVAETGENYSPESIGHAVDNLEPKSIDIQEGDTGHSYESLFGPYIKGAKRIEVVDPYIRMDYQVRNFRDFCAIIDTADGEVEVSLLTGADNKRMQQDISNKLDTVAAGLADRGVNLSYGFRGANHDRWIQTDTGWRIVLGRGLDMFQNPERCGFDEQNQKLRRCKATTITFVKIGFDD